MKTQIIDSPTALYWASFNRFELRVSGEAVCAIAHPGPADSDVAEYAPQVRAQMEADNFPNRPTPEKIRAELAEYGAWDDDELADDEANWRRIVWCAACNIAEDKSPDCSEPDNTAPAWTPGPWTYQMTISSSGPVPQVQTVPVGPDGGRYSTLICTLSRTGEKSGTRESNARLIAAAPEMAQTIQDALDWTDGDIEAHRANGESERDLAFLEARASQLRAILARINGEGGGK